MKFPTMIKKVILRILCKNHNFWTTSSYEKPSVHFYPVFHFAPVSPTLLLFQNLEDIASYPFFSGLFCYLFCPSREATLVIPFGR